MRNSGWKYACVAMVAAVALSMTANAQQRCLIISEVVDGDLTGGYPKFVELTNTSDVAIDLSSYSIGTVSNGATTMGYDAMVLSGVLAAGDSWVVSFEAADVPGVSTFYDVYGFDADDLRQSSYFNGNDVIVLFYGAALSGDAADGTGAEVVDIYGVVGGVADSGDYSAAWCYNDGYAYRLSSIYQPAGATFAIGEWSVNQLALDGVDATGHAAVTDPGTHTFTGSCTPYEDTGACCVGATCTTETEADCDTMSGVFWGAGSTCSPSPCEPATGACTWAASCIDDLTEAECVRLDGTWEGAGTTCTDPCEDCITVQEAKALGYDEGVVLCDVVVTSEDDTVNNSGYTTLFVQEADSSLGGGIELYGTNANIEAITDHCEPGDIIRISGVTDIYNSLFELTAPFDCFEIITAGAGVPEPLVVNTVDINDGEDYENMLVTLYCATFQDGGDTFVGGTSAANYYVDDGAGSCVVRIPTGAHPLANTTIPTGPVDIVGILSQNGSTYQLMPLSVGGIIDPSVNCPEEGACCLGTTCEIYTEAECISLSGTYMGDGTLCEPCNPCDPTGICCVAGVCTEEREADCVAMGGGYMGDCTTCDDNVCALPVEGGDIAYGLSDPDPFDTAKQIREGYQVGAWTALYYLQAMEFDNFKGVLHNARGNLLALDYGTTDDPFGEYDGGTLFNMATDGSNRWEMLYRFNATYDGGVADTRTSGLSVSCDNRYVAVWGVDPGELHVLEYDSGPATTVGTGSGAAIGNVWTCNTISNAGGTQGTAWLYEAGCGCDAPTTYTILTYNSAFIPGSTVLHSVEFDPALGTFAVTAELTIYVAGGQFTDVEYNPNVSPYIYCIATNYDGESTTWLTVVDPSTWSVYNQVDLSTSCNGGRELALGQDGWLYLSQYHSSSGDSIDRLDTATVDTWTDGSSESYYTDGYSSFNGIDAAFDAPCAGDSNCDGSMNFDDIDYFVAALVAEANWEAMFTGTPPCSFKVQNDINNDCNVNFDDIDGFVARLVEGGCPNNGL